MIVTICISIVFLSLVILHVAICSSKAARLLKTIPNPTPLPIIGNLLMLNVPTARLWDLSLKLLHDYPRMRLWFLNINVVTTRSAEDAKTILSCKKNINKCKRLVYNGFKIRGLDMDGILVSNDEKWRQRRKLILPTFNPNLMRVYVEIMNDYTGRLVDNINNENTESTVIDTAKVFREHAFRIMSKATMGVDPSEYGVEEEEKFRSSFDEIIDLVLYRAARPHITDWMYWMMELLITGRKQERSVETFRAFSSKIIRTRREYHEKIGYEKLRNLIDDVEDQNTTNGGTKRLALLDLLFTAKTEGLIDDKGIRDEVEIFMGAGYETNAIASALTLMLLAENKHVQDLAREEVTQMLDRTGGILKMAELNRLDYLQRCIKESLRLYPSAPFIGRLITEDIQLENHHIPRGTDVGIHLYLLHRDPNYWPDPEKFDPDRFLPENSKKHYPFAYQPFSGGPRGCIGLNFAMLELKTVIARILYNFHIEPVDFLANMKLRMHIVLRPETPCRIRLIRIKRESNA